MKKLLFLLLLALTPLLSLAGDGGTLIEQLPFEITSINVGTFAGIVALISMLSTEVFKLIPAVNSRAWAKIGISATIGILISLAAWNVNVAPQLIEFPIHEVIVYGLMAGLAGSGFYDILKIFKKDDDTHT